jgi:type III secretion system YscQ/HrcQ family protein
LFEFLLLSVLSRANQDLNIPFQFSLTPFKPLSPDVMGVCVEFTVGLTEAFGIVELFLPAELLDAANRSRPVLSFTPSTLSLTWPVAVAAGHADVSAQEFTELEVGDVLLLTAEYSLLLPSDPTSGERGWNAVLLGDKPPRLKLQDYFERNSFMESQPVNQERGDSPDKPDLAKLLPVRVHVVLQQLEMTLEAFQTLGPGSVVRLDRDKSEPVQIAANGKILGTGELVEIDGRLGVRISNWAAK